MTLPTQLMTSVAGAIERNHGDFVHKGKAVAASGVRTTYGSLVYKDWIPDHSDCLVERLGVAASWFTA